MAGQAAPAVRVAGSARLDDGSIVTWVLAEGGRGRRWRAISMGPDGRFALALLLEVDTGGRPTRLELAGADALLTLHPSDDGLRLHGNVVRPAGIEHVDLPWSPDHMLVAAGSPITAAAAASWLEGRVGVGEGETVPAVEVRQQLQVRPATWRVARVGERRWRLVAADGGADMTVDLDDSGVPAAFAGDRTWPLELQTAG
jgi:hypothetical protein